MAFGLIHFFPGGTKEQYEATVGALHPSKDVLPKGQIYHVAGPSAGGWTVVAVHESKENWEAFRDTILMPGLMKGVPGGFPTPPQETTFDTYKLLP